MNCKKVFYTEDNLQGNIITCPYCEEEYFLKENKIYCIKKLKELEKKLEDNKPIINDNKLISDEKIGYKSVSPQESEEDIIHYKI